MSRSIYEYFSILTNYLVNKFIRRLSLSGAPICIVGCGHSGSSLLLSIVGSHSNIYPIPYESRFGARKNKKKYLKRFEKLTIAAGKTRWIEKTPKHIHYINEILESCPDTKFLLILRDGRDVVCSYKARFGDINFGINDWVTDNTEAKKYFNHQNVFTLKYESLIDDFDHTVRKILEFLNEPYDDKIKYYYQEPKYFYSNKIDKPPTSEDKYHNQYRNWQINQPLFDGRNRWKEMTNEEKTRFKQEAGKLLIELGYESNNDW